LVEARHERAGGVPLVPPSIVRHRSMRRGLALASPFFTGFGGFMFVYAVATQSDLHWTPERAGLALAPLAATFLVASLLTSRLVARHGRQVLTVGGVLQGLGLAVLVATVAATWPQVSAYALIPGMAIAGFGQGLIISPLFGVVLSEVPVASAGIGSGVLSTTQQTSLALGTGLLGTLFLSLTSTYDARVGLIVILLLNIGIAGVVTMLSTRLPDPRVQGV
jgi:MFS family permease